MSATSKVVPTSTTYTQKKINFKKVALLKQILIIQKARQRRQKFQNRGRQKIIQRTDNIEIKDSSTKFKKENKKFQVQSSKTSSIKGYQDSKLKQEFLAGEKLL